MKIHAIISFLCLASVALGTSCKDDETHFLQRSHDALSFPYLNSTKELLVLTNGSWKITPDDTWISCSPGEGNGAPKEQAVNITVAQNDGAERTGSVTLSDGLKELVIRVTQEDGFFTVGSPEIAPSFDLYEELVDKRVTIPYQKSKPGYKADVTATLEGAGAEGIAIESLSGYEMEAGDGAIPLALSGTPTKKGPITVKLHVEISSVATPYDLTAESRAKLAGEVTVTMFKLLPRLAVLDWGDYEKGTGTNFNNGTPRSFSFGLALEEEGDNLRNYTSKTANWLTASSMFFAHNRFAFGNLQPSTTYWFSSPTSWVPIRRIRTRRGCRSPLPRRIWRRTSSSTRISTISGSEAVRSTRHSASKSPTPRSVRTSTPTTRTARRPPEKS